MNIPAGTIKRLHVDKHVIARNRKTGSNDPTITVQTSKGAHKARTVHVYGPSSFVQAHGERKPLSCGARVWIETRAELVLA
jgi:hypothetical protein